MPILAINCGSSSIKTAVIDTGGACVLELRVEGVGSKSARIRTDDVARPVDPALDLAGAADLALREIRARIGATGELSGVVHRVAHGGDRFTRPVIIDDQVLRDIEQLGRLAPLHNPPALAALRQARAAFPSIPHVAVFDTAFHATLPRRAREYALPAELRERYGIRRYGFHGINHAHVMERVAERLGKPARELRIISCHLGNGASMAAIEYGRSIETSMGMTPLEGLVMGTRPGDVDPGVLLELMRDHDRAALDDVFNRGSGLTGLAGTEDMAQIEARAAEGDENCRLAIAICAHRIRKYLGAYAATMGGVDAIAFTGGVGEHSALIRHRSLQRLGFLGAVLDEDANRDVRVSADSDIHCISDASGRVALFVVRAGEEAAMAREASALLERSSTPKPVLRVPIAVSARHAHLSQRTIDSLFGSGYQLRARAELSQPGQYSAEEAVTLIGPRGVLRNVRLMGPPRTDDQIEISRSDEFMLGVDAPVRISGDLANTPGIPVEGPAGRVTLSRGLICARRHIHMSPGDATQFGVKDCDVVDVRIDSKGRDLVFGDVMIRVSPAFRLELHLDTDEANAAGVEHGDFAQIVSRP